jgi:hypothetical protein
LKSQIDNAGAKLPKIDDRLLLYPANEVILVARIILEHANGNKEFFADKKRCLWKIISRRVDKVSKGVLLQTSS